MMTMQRMPKLRAKWGLEVVVEDTRMMRRSKKRLAVATDAVGARSCEGSKQAAFGCRHHGTGEIKAAGH